MLPGTPGARTEPDFRLRGGKTYAKKILNLKLNETILYKLFFY